MIVKKLKEKGYRLKYLLIAIDLPKSTYYFEINKIDAVKVRNKNIENKISEIFNNHKGRYGVRRVYRELLKQGYKINHKKVQRIMHELKLFGKRPREKYHSYKGKVGKIADNIIDRNFKAENHYKNGVLMYLNLTFHGVNAAFHQYLICILMR